MNRLYQRVQAKVTNLMAGRRNRTSLLESLTTVDPEVDRSPKVAPIISLGRKTNFISPTACQHPVCRSLIRKAKIKCFFCNNCPHLVPQFSFYTCCQNYLCMNCRLKLEFQQVPRPVGFLLTGQLASPCPLCLLPISRVTNISTPESSLSHCQSFLSSDP